VLLDLAAVVAPDVDVHPHHEAVAAEDLEQGRRVDQRAAVRDAGLDDEVGAHLPDELLNGEEVLRQLDDGPAEPAEVVRVAPARDLQEPGARQRLHVGIAQEAVDVGADLA